MNIYTNMDAQEIRDDIGGKENIDVEYLSQAVMVLCAAVSRLEAKIEKLETPKQ